MNKLSCVEDASRSNLSQEEKAILIIQGEHFWPLWKIIIEQIDYNSILWILLKELNLSILLGILSSFNLAIILVFNFEHNKSFFYCWIHRFQLLKL